MSYQCPKCKSSEIMTVEASVDASLSESGELECLGSNLQFDESSHIECGVCGHHGRADSFESSDPPSERQQFELTEGEWNKFLGRLGFEDGEVP